MLHDSSRLLHGVQLCHKCCTLLSLLAGLLNESAWTSRAAQAAQQPTKRMCLEMTPLILAWFGCHARVQALPKPVRVVLRMRAQARLAEEHSARLSRMQDDMPTAAYGDPTREWIHLPLSQACSPTFRALGDASTPLL